MDVLEFTLLVGGGSLAAGLLGSLTGLGGGVVIVPMLTAVFHIDIRYAIGASLISVIATSSGAASAYVREGYSNIRVGMFLEIATSVGALSGAFIASRIPTSAISIIFGLALLYSGFQSFQRQHALDARNTGANHLAQILKLDSTYPAPGGMQAYHVQAVPLGFLMMIGAGLISGLLGIGSGAFKVLAMDRAMKLPFKVSTTTSNFMIGVTAAASAGVYFSRGYIDPGISMPVMLGVLIGSTLGAKVLMRAPVKTLRQVFGVVILFMGAQMIYSGIKAEL